MICRTFARLYMHIAAHIAIERDGVWWEWNGSWNIKSIAAITANVENDHDIYKHRPSRLPMHAISLRETASAVRLVCESPASVWPSLFGLFLWFHVWRRTTQVTQATQAAHLLKLCRIVGNLFHGFRQIRVIQNSHRKTAKKVEMRF